MIFMVDLEMIAIVVGAVHIDKEKRVTEVSTVIQNIRGEVLLIWLMPGSNDEKISSIIKT